MGYFYQHGSRADMIRDLIAPIDEGRSVCLRHCCRGNVLWSVWEDPAGRSIRCDLMIYHGGDWGYKPMDESCGPFYYTCPLAYLAMVPEVACQEWRDSVIRHHERMRQRRKLRVTLSLTIEEV